MFQIWLHRQSKSRYILGSVGFKGIKMNKVVAYLVTSGAMLVASGLPALADHGQRHGRGKLRSVPEIDASAGLLAIAAVLVIVAFVWERNRRAA
jgi:hypothetical protein